MKRSILIIMLLLTCAGIFSGCRQTTTITDCQEKIQPVDPSSCIGYENDDCILSFPRSRAIVKVKEEYVPYLCRLDGALLAEADRKIVTHISRSNDPPQLYLTINDDDKLCLSGEIIVSLDNDSAINGCGFDHDHVFLNEPITD